MGCIYHRLTFLTGIAQTSQLTNDSGWEVAFAGRSNVGKSSALNALANQRGLARTSKTPGRTQHVNLFALDDQRRIADLPGYGYAAVAQQIQRDWEILLREYIETRRSLRGIVVLMDSRRPFTELDQNMLQWCTQRNHPVHVLLTKADKLGANETRRVRDSIKNELQHYPSVQSFQLFSATSGVGLLELYSALDRWFEHTSDCNR